MSRTTARRNYYAVLQVPPWADLAAITKAYKRMALKMHPDKNRDRNATAEFQLLGEAYETLRDVDKRRQYDSAYIQTDHFDAKRREHNSTESSASIRKEIERVRRFVFLYGALQLVRHEIEVIFRGQEKELLRLRIYFHEEEEKLLRNFLEGRI